MQARQYKLKRSPPDARDHVHVHALAPPPHGAELPKKVDLRAEMPGVLDQGSLGSCASNAASNCLRHLMRKERAAREFQPSRLYLYWNTRVNVERSPAGEDTGVCIRDVCKAVQRYHACDEAVWPYVIDRFGDAPPLAAYKDADLHRELRYASVPQSLPALRRTLAGGFPVVVGIQVYDSFESAAVARTGDVPLPDRSAEQCLGGHAVLVVGYDDARAEFLVMNSWGADWGQGGYFTLPYAYLLDPALGSDFWVFSRFE
jgi:C1A family cysteine protease